jgi:hypothetical protein
MALSPRGTMARRQWWKLKPAETYSAIFEQVNWLYENHSDRTMKNQRCSRLYGNSDYIGSPVSYTQGGSTTGTQLPEDRVKMNVIASMADTVHSKISKMKPRVTFLTSGGDYFLGEEAKKLTKFIDGVFYDNDIYTLHQAGFRDATVFDIGATKHYIKGNKIVSERVLANELFVDEIDAIYGQPQSLYQVKVVHKDVLIAAYPKKKASIELSTSGFKGAGLVSEEMRDYVLVIEAWHLPADKDSGDGRHVISIEKDYLVDEEYTRDYFPFTFFRWTSRLTGFWGQSLTERLIGIQLEINKLLRLIQKAFHLGSAFKVFLEHGSKVAKEAMNNELGQIIYYSGSKPEFYAPKVVNDEVFRHLQFLIQSGYEEAGISQLSATSKKPAGLESGKALREYNNIETERFAITSQEYEQSFLETARQYVDLVKELAEEGTDYEAVAESKKFIEKIKWSEIDINDNEFIMKMFPTSMLPTTPAGRMEYVQELINNEFIPREYALTLLDFPDLDEYSQFANAPINNLKKALYSIINKGEYTPPEPYQDLRGGLAMFQNAYLWAKDEGVPEAKLELIRRWMTNAEAMLSQAQQQTQAQQSMMDAAAAQQAAPAPGAELPPSEPSAPTAPII